ncbi:MAG: response regulator, partial [Muribaculaceae bacterium]|nr:response regulator [Muribaculaceae bacterium]
MIHRTRELQHMEDNDENLLILSTFDVVEFCRGVFEVFKENNSQKKFVFHSSCPKLFIEADAVKFESAITNLLSNACKYSDDGATISCGISANGSEVEITVSDDGVGIADIDQPLVFQRMFRSPSTSKLHEGTGLGLYLIKKYLELMKGNIALYSKEGQGTTFVVTLPMSEQTLPASGNRGAAEKPGNAKILIVEDNMQISGFIADILRDSYTCFTAENGRSGLAIAASIIPDLIIVDEMMPIMNGLEMVRRIKQHPRLSSIPIVMLTAKSDNSTENESIKLGIDVFMTKPFEPSALTVRISQLLKGRTEIKEKVRIQAIAEAESKPIEAESVNEKTLARIAKVIEDNISDPDLNVNLLCEKSGIPNKQLYRLIKKYMGIGPLDYIRRVRLQKAAVLLSQHRFTVAEISYMVGFKTPSYFAKCFQNQ